MSLMGKQYRFTATVPKHVYEWITETATNQGRKPSNLASFLLIRATEEEIAKDSNNSTTTNDQEEAA